MVTFFLSLCSGAGKWVQRCGRRSGHPLKRNQSISFRSPLSSLICSKFYVLARLQAGGGREGELNFSASIIVEKECMWMMRRGRARTTPIVSDTHRSSAFHQFTWFTFLLPTLTQVHPRQLYPVRADRLHWTSLDLFSRWNMYYMCIYAWHLLTWI